MLGSAHALSQLSNVGVRVQHARIPDSLSTCAMEHLLKPQILSQLLPTTRHMLQDYRGLMPIPERTECQWEIAIVRGPRRIKTGRELHLRYQKEIPEDWSTRLVELVEINMKNVLQKLDISLSSSEKDSRRRVPHCPYNQERVRTS